MTQAYVMVVAAGGMAPEVCEQIRTFEGVSEAHVVSGDFDVIVEVDTEDVRDLATLLTDHIRPLEGVGHTRTHVALG